MYASFKEFPVDGKFAIKGTPPFKVTPIPCGPCGPCGPIGPCGPGTVLSAPVSPFTINGRAFQRLVPLPIFNLLSVVSIPSSPAHKILVD